MKLERAETRTRGGDDDQKTHLFTTKGFSFRKGKKIEETLLGNERDCGSRTSSQSTPGLRGWKADARRVEVKESSGEGAAPLFAPPARVTPITPQQRRGGVEVTPHAFLWGKGGEKTKLKCFHFYLFSFFLPVHRKEAHKAELPGGPGVAPAAARLSRGPAAAPGGHKEDSSWRCFGGCHFSGWFLIMISSPPPLPVCLLNYY